MRAFVACLLLAGCSSSSTSSEERGARYTVVCRNEVQDCYDRATSLCPDGYIVDNRVRGRKVGEETEYSVIVRCKVRQ